MRERFKLAARRHPDVVILDLGLPTMDGLDVVRGLRGWTSVPIVVLSGRGTEAAKVEALDLGADDYLTKPFGMDELFARLRAAVRRAVLPEGRTVLTTPDFTIDFVAKQVRRGDEVVRLTPTQWHIVEVLVRNAGRLVTYEQLLHEVWGPTYGKETNYLRVFMTQIRHKLEPEPSHPSYFITEPGIGFRFEMPRRRTPRTTEAESERALTQAADGSAASARPSVCAMRDRDLSTPGARDPTRDRHGLEVAEQLVSPHHRDRDALDGQDHVASLTRRLTEAEMSGVVELRQRGRAPREPAVLQLEQSQELRADRQLYVLGASLARDMEHAEEGVRVRHGPQVGDSLPTARSTRPRGRPRGARASSRCRCHWRS